jgi:hypothetical protein
MIGTHAEGDSPGGGKASCLSRFSPTNPCIVGRGTVEERDLPAEHRIVAKVDELMNGIAGYPARMPGRDQ